MKLPRDWPLGKYETKDALKRVPLPTLAHADDDRDTALCQVCGDDTPDPSWRPDVTGMTHAGNVCPACLAVYERMYRKTFDEVGKALGALDAAIKGMEQSE